MDGESFSTTFPARVTNGESLQLAPAGPRSRNPGRGIFVHASIPEIRECVALGRGDGAIGDSDRRPGDEKGARCFYWGHRGIVWVKNADSDPEIPLPMPPGKGPAATEAPRENGMMLECPPLSMARQETVGGSGSSESENTESPESVGFSHRNFGLVVDRVNSPKAVRRALQQAGRQRRYVHPASARVVAAVP